jgi:hypothetical protein
MKTIGDGNSSYQAAARKYASRDVDMIYSFTFLYERLLAILLVVDCGRFSRTLLLSCSGCDGEDDSSCDECV